MKKYAHALLLVALAAVVGCSGGKQVTRIDPDEQVDL